MRRRARLQALFFDARVVKDGVWFLDTGAEFSKPFYSVSMPPTMGGACVLAQIGQLRAGLLYGALYADQADPRGAVLYSTWNDEFGINVQRVLVPAGAYMRAYVSASVSVCGEGWVPCVHVCACLCVRVCARACVRACVRRQ